jgi:hypothetical protein
LAAQFGLLVADAQDVYSPAPERPNPDALEIWRLAAEDFEKAFSKEKKIAEDLKELLQAASEEAE